MTGAKIKRPSNRFSPDPCKGFGISGGCEAVTDAPAPGLSSPAATAGSRAPKNRNAERLYAPELTAYSHIGVPELFI